MYPSVAWVYTNRVMPSCQLHRIRVHKTHPYDVPCLVPLDPRKGRVHRIPPHVRIEAGDWHVRRHGIIEKRAVVGWPDTPACKDRTLNISSDCTCLAHCQSKFNGKMSLLRRTAGGEGGAVTEGGVGFEGSVRGGELGCELLLDGIGDIATH